MAGALSSELGASRVFVGGSAVSGAWDRDAAGLFVEELFGRHHGEIYAYLIRMIRDPELAADLTQDAFVKAYRAYDSLEKPENARAWLYQIATASRSTTSAARRSSASCRGPANRGAPCRPRSTS
jgi:predicted RNA polymerase sigma factor